MADSLPIKDTKELLVGVLEISLVLVERFKDGIGLDDGVAIYDKFVNDPEFKAKVLAAYDGYKNVSAEAKDLSIAEIIELLVVSSEYVKKFVGQVK